MKVVVQIPCFNEAETLPLVLKGIPRTMPGVSEVVLVVIDDGSTDATVDVANRHGADQIVRHPTNQGLAAAFRSGLKVAMSLDADVIVNTDGDNQYPGEALPRLIEPIMSGRADLVVGNRCCTQDKRVGRMKRLLYAVGYWAMRFASGANVHDPTSGYRAMTSEVAGSIELTHRFSYTLETIFQAASLNLRIAEVPIRANRTDRPSRLFGSLFEYLFKSSKIMIRCFAKHRLGIPR